MMHSFAVDHDSQLKSPGRQCQPSLEAVDLGGDRAPARLGRDQSFDSGPLAEGDLDRIEAALAGEQLEEILLKKGCVHAEFQRQRTPKAGPQFDNQLRTKASAPVESWTLPGRFLSRRICPVWARWASSG
jgi:hypothetical protein